MSPRAKRRDLEAKGGPKFGGEECSLAHGICGPRSRRHLSTPLSACRPSRRLFYLFPGPFCPVEDVRDRRRTVTCVHVWTGWQRRHTALASLTPQYIPIRSLRRATATLELLYPPSIDRRSNAARSSTRPWQPLTAACATPTKSQETPSSNATSQNASERLLRNQHRCPPTLRPRFPPIPLRPLTSSGCLLTLCSLASCRGIGHGAPRVHSAT